MNDFPKVLREVRSYDICANVCLAKRKHIFPGIDDKEDTIDGDSVNGKGSGSKIPQGIHHYRNI